MKFKAIINCVIMRQLLHIIALILLFPSYLNADIEHGERSNTVKPSPHRNHLQTIIVDHYYPYTFVNQDGTPDGFSVDLMKAVTRVMGMELEIRADTWDTARSALRTGDIDFLPMMAYSAARDKVFDFSVPHTIAYDAFFTRRSTQKIRSIDDLRGKKILVMKNDQAHDYIQSIDFISPNQLVLIDSLPEALRQLSSGNGDAALMPKLVGLFFIRNLKLTNLEPSPIVVESYKRPFSITVKEGNLALLERLSQGLSIVRETGHYKEIYEKWFGAIEPTGLSANTAIKYFTLITLAFILTGGVLFLWSLSLKKKVASRTRNLEDEINERKLTEYALKESEGKYRTLIENLPQNIFLKNIDSVFISCNDNFAEEFNLKTHEIPGKTDFDLFPEELAKRYRTDDKRVMTSGITEDIEEPYVQDGKNFWVHTVKTPVRDERGAIVGILGIFWDITEQKLTEERNTRLGRILDDSLNEIYIFDANSLQFTLVNKGAQENLMYSMEELNKLTPLDLNPEFTLETFDNLIQPLRSGEKENIQFTTMHRRKNGTLYPVEVSLQLAGFELSPVFVAIILDISERKKAKEALRISEEKFSKAFRSSPNFIVISTLKEGRFLEVNNAFMEISGYDREEVIGHTSLEIGLWVNPVDRNHMVKALRESGNIRSRETDLRMKNGDIISVLYSAELIDIEDEPCVMAIVLDITERQKLERQLLHAQKMESVGTLAGGIAHDFNNIITAIIGFSSILNRRMQKDDPLKIFINNIQTAAENAANLTSNLLTFSRKQTIKPVLLDLNELIFKLEKFLLRIIGEDILFKTILTEKQLNTMVDFGQMEQVLMNLVTNARDSMPKGGELTIQTESVRIDNEFIKFHGYGEPGHYTLISISDTGTGMDEITKEKIFEPFFTTKEVNKGTGLGLAMVYGIIKQHKGYINVDSMPGAGTTFRIYLPMAGKDISEQQEKAFTEAVPDRGGETILIAEDDSMIRNLLSSVFTEFGYSVITAEDGEDAVNKFMENKDTIQFLILDAIMPKKYGSAAYDEIKRIKPDIKGIFLSGYTKETIQEKNIKDKGIRLIHKPVRPESLLTIVREELDKD